MHPRREVATMMGYLNGRIIVQIDHTLRKRVNLRVQQRVGPLIFVDKVSTYNARLLEEKT